jgi:hypothetical protein
MRMARVDCARGNSNHAEKVEEREETVSCSACGAAISMLDEAGKLVPLVNGQEAATWARDAGSHFTAADIVNRYSEAELGRVLREYGEDWRRWRADARAIVAARQNAPIQTTFELLRALGMHAEESHGDGSASNPNQKRSNKVASQFKRRKGGAHPATRTFQALRIEVRLCLTALTSLLDQ